MLFERPLALEPGALARVAPAVERAGIHLGVWFDDGVGNWAPAPIPGRGLRVWGMTRAVPDTTFVLEVAAPGLLVVKHHRGESGKFVNVAVLEGDAIKVIDELASNLYRQPPILASMLGSPLPASWLDPVNVLMQLAVSMRAHGRGGSLLVVPPDSEWHASIVRPIPYAVSPPFTELAVLSNGPVGGRHQDWEDALARTVSAVAGLTAVDGAVILTSAYDLLAFGAKIARRRGSPPVEQVKVTEPIEGAEPWHADPGQLGGTRHLSAAQFVHDQRDAIALVASQDGRFTVFAWSRDEAIVHAHRIDVLLM
jgi:hypothetical protein